jgi:hypothetical protein
MFAISSRRFVRAVVLSCVLVAVTTAVYSEQKPNPVAVSLAQEIITLKGSTAIVMPVVGSVIDRVKTMHLQTNPILSKPLEEVAAQLRKEFAKLTADLQHDVALVYASRFTEAELKQILAFYKTPVGQKVIREEPGIFEASLQQLQAFQDRFAQEVISRFRTEMKKRGHEL